MAVWDIDLTTRAGARTGAYQASLVCFAFAGFSVIGALIFGGMGMLRTPIALAFLAGQVVLGLISGFMLRKDRGAWWGAAVAALIGLSLVGQLLTLNIGGLIIWGVMLAILANGLRGAFALQKGRKFEDDDLEVFS